MADILRKTQKENESFEEFSIEIQTVIRRQGSFTTSQELEQIYTNIHPGYRNYIERRDFSSLKELTQLAVESEALQNDLKTCEFNERKYNYERISSLGTTTAELFFAGIEQGDIGVPNA
ncbi:hypothetical protein HHI36_022228 [Cryptolaemus montrouzieri]|uniref:Uncharacterized protein n=1 Tax=Cryptolaemus montrouzieri TaxID=559131 RepID=A0ABD2MZ39_9CUCU